MAAQISSKHILSSSGGDMPIIRSLELRYPLQIHAELMTHRKFSRNARSSRAVPVKRMIEEVMTEPFIPRYWGKNQKGMQATEEHDAPVFITETNSIGEPQLYEYTNEAAWLHARDAVVKIVEGFEEAGYHKQVVNRLLAPWLHIDVLVTSTNFSNWFALRDHPAAEPHIRDLAVAMRESVEYGPVQELKEGEWHLPYIQPVDWADAAQRAIAQIGLRPPDMTVHEWQDHKRPINLKTRAELVKLSVPRCAAISYRPFHEGDRPLEAELAKHDELAANGHWSPFEHQATPDWANQTPLHGNLDGWIQYRKLFDGECR